VEGFRFLEHVLRDPYRKRNLARRVGAGLRVLLDDAGDAPGLQFRRDARERGPEPPVHERQLAADEPADEHVVRFLDRLERAKDLAAGRMPPPAALHGRAGDRVGEPGRGTRRAHEHDAVLFDEGERLGRCHRRHGTIRAMAPTFGRSMRPVFLLAADGTFLNHGSFGACPKDVLAGQGRIRYEMESQPDVFFRREIMPREGETALRAAAARIGAFINAPAECVAFVENATAGVQAALGSIDFVRGDRILITNHTYNAMRLMVDARCRETGAVPLVVEIPTPTTADDILERFAGASDGHPGEGRGPIRAAILDHITSPTALVMPLERIIPPLRAQGTLVIVDGAHAIGQVPLDIAALAPDWYVTNLHKWLFAPKGTAIFYASKAVAPKTRPNVVSHFIDMGFPASFDYTGTRDNSGWLAAPAALEFFEDLGPESVWAYQSEMVDKVEGRFAGLGITAVAPKELCAAMRSLILPQKRRAAKDDGDKLIESLWKVHRIQVWSKTYEDKLLLRISSQVYVDDDDVQHLRDVLARDGWPGR